MKTSEFIRKALEIEGVEQYNVTDESILLLDKSNQVIATASVSERFGIDTRYFLFNNMDEIEKIELSILLYEYAITPLGEREEEEEGKYYLRHTLCKEQYLNYDVDGKVLLLSDAKEILGFKTSYTAKEWEKLTNLTWQELLTQFNAEDV